jgi:hypothetical protein
MKVSEDSITAIARVVTGDEPVSRYRSGPRLVHFFNSYGSNDVYGQGFPSRWAYAEDKVRQLNDSPALADLLREVMHPKQFVGFDGGPNAAYSYLNERLKHDGYELTLPKSGVGQPIIRTSEGSLVDFSHPGPPKTDDTRDFLEEQIAKCDQKLREGDYDGAVTNARSLLEAVLLELEGEYRTEPVDYDGDLPRLYRRVQKLLDLEPARPDLDTPLKQVLSGLTSVVAGIAGLSNKMGDRHARSYRPGKRHAILVVDSAKTLSSFLMSTRLARQHSHQPTPGPTQA